MLQLVRLASAGVGQVLDEGGGFLAPTATGFEGDDDQGAASRGQQLGVGGLVVSPSRLGDYAVFVSSSRLGLAVRCEDRPQGDVHGKLGSGAAWQALREDLNAPQVGGVEAQVHVLAVRVESHCGACLPAHSCKSSLGTGGRGCSCGVDELAARGVGVARACLEESIIYSQNRKTFGKPICEHQSIQIKLADMACRVESARLLTEQAAEAYDRGDRSDLEAGIAKLVATEAAMENASEAMRLHGAYGYSPEYNIERYYRDAPLLCIGEGTNELQRLIIARQLIEQNPA